MQTRPAIMDSYSGANSSLFWIFQTTYEMVNILFFAHNSRHNDSRTTLYSKN